jgi:sulfatase modifying factor 1
MDVGTMRRGVAVFAVATALAAACSTFSSENDDGTPRADAASDSPIESASPIDAIASASDAGDAAVDGADAGPCPIGLGPDMVVVDIGTRTICIDRTEVTSAHYAAFLASHTGAGALAPYAMKVAPQCALITPPGLTAADDGGARPRRSIDYCSAALFCVAQGKRLCGNVGDGGAIVFASDGGSEHPLTEWELACANGRSVTYYPWGTMNASGAVAAKCETRDYDDASTGPRAAGAEPACATVSGALDMIGNVWEWVNMPVDNDGGASYTAVRGGAWDGVTAPFGCGTQHGFASSSGNYAGGDPTAGFRCCADPN